MTGANWRKAIWMVTVLSMTCSFQLPAQNQSAPRGKTVASVSGTLITEEDLVKAAAEQLEKLTIQQLQAEASLRQERHQMLESTLNQIIEERLLDAEARRLGVKGADLLAREVQQKIKEPTQEEVNAFYESNKARISTPKDRVLPQILQYLRQQSSTQIRKEFFDRLRKQHEVIVSLEPLRFEVESAGHPSQGPSASPILLVEFSDFKCGFCKSFYATLKRILKEYGPSVRLVYRQYPLVEIHPEAPKAAEASLCAADQGKFWPMHDYIFDHQDKMTVADLKAAAAAIALDKASFNACLDSGKHAERVKKDIYDGARSGVTGTPATFINGRFISGARPYEDLIRIIDDELKRKAGAALKP